MTPRTLVLGIGNPLVGDEGVGVRVAEWLMTHWRFPESVDVMDAGTMGMGMLGPLSEYGRVVVVDAVDGTGEPPGTVLAMAPADLAPNQVLHSLHDVRLADVLEAAALVGTAPDVAFIGVQVGEMHEMVTDLTPEVEASVPEAAAAIFEVLDGWGVEPAEPMPADPEAARVIRAIRTRETMRREE